MTPTMAVIQIITPDMFRDDDVIAPTERATPGEGGGYVPGGLAGYTYDGAAYCPRCAAECEVTSAEDGETYSLDRFPSFTDDGEHVTDARGFGVGVVSGTDEWDYPGASCHVCHRTLDTNILVYDDCGAHPDAAEALLDGVEPATVGVLERDDTEARVILLEDCRPYGDAGDISWIPADELQDDSE